MIAGGAWGESRNLTIALAVHLSLARNSAKSPLQMSISQRSHILGSQILYCAGAIATEQLKVDHSEVPIIAAGVLPIANANIAFIKYFLLKAQIFLRAVHAQDILNVL